MKKKKLSLILTLIIASSLNFNVLAAGNSAAKETEPQIYGKAAITIDMKTGEIIYAKDVDTKMYPASTTKLLTALLLAENKNKNDVLKYTQKAKVQPASSLNTDLHPINADETMTAQDVMDGLLLYSGNDMAYVIAEGVGKDDADFMNKMNEKVKQLNLKNTHFVTPNGLHDPNHYTTAYDLSTIASTAFQNSWVRESMGKQKASIKTSKGTIFAIQNRNKLLGKEGCIGGKTGYTSDAGKCLVTVYERDGRKILGVVMKSVYDATDMAVFNDMEKVINWSYASKPTVLYKAGDIVTTKTIKYKPLIIGPEKTINVPICVKEDIGYYDNYVNKNELSKTINLSNINTSTLKGESSIGNLTVKERNLSNNYKLYSTISKATLAKNNVPYYAAAAAAVLCIIGIVAYLVKKLIDLNRRNKRGKYI
ncbi:D-alanyl-D-alanine carboxypeptidase [Clostridium sp. P21]|uniref:D-alanyl-D-alanine carboxypeptidase n=1 Tax=Clostridium muellerianum TaxID=2716538 RepID=A0A7Y0EGN1_9CLOT|nr:D-alanyl-D-alanine carboxypeptidase family protein [Clostridium muellerianum]NMM63144.1 D-alanyl-D-alanine carboxypeptidase [Clostridium muellerianum]